MLNDIYKATVYKDRWLVYLEGLGNTLLITVCALAIGILIGLTVALLRVWCGPEKNGLQSGVMRMVNGHPPCPFMAWHTDMYTESTSGRSSRSTLIQI